MKKFLSALIAVVCCCCTFFISVSAEEDTYTEEKQTIIELAIDGIADYKRLYDGDITVEQFYSSINQRTGKMYYNTFVDKAIVIQMLNDIGIDTESYFQDYLDWRFGEDYNNQQLQGYGAFLSANRSADGLQFTYCYGDYGVISLNSDGSIKSYHLLNETSSKFKYVDSNYSINPPIISEYETSKGYSCLPSNLLNYGGDWRYVDGTKVDIPSAPIGDLPQSPSDLPEDLFNDFLDDLSEELKKNQVDLTNLNKVTAEMLNKINNFYNAFTGNDFLTNEHFDTFLKEGKQYFNGKEIAGTLYNVIPKDKNFFQNLTHKDTMLVEYEGKNYYLETDGTLLYKDNKYYFVDMNYFSDDGTLNKEDDSEKELFDFNQGKIDNAFGTSKKSTLSESAVDVMVKRLKPFMRISVVVKHVVNSIDGNPTQIHAQINGIDYCVVDFATFDNYISYIRVLTVGILYLALGIKIFKDISKVIANGG